MVNYTFLNLPQDDEVGRVIREEMTDQFSGERVLIGEDGTCMPEMYIKFDDSIKNFEIFDSDVIVTTYPKTGTTWTQEMVWLIANDLDYKGAELQQLIRFPFLELCTLCDWDKLDTVFNDVSPEYLNNSIEFTKQMKHPRFIKTHLPFSLLPDDIRNGSKKPKMIYVMRNPKDTCVSYFHHGQVMERYRSTLENFAKVFLADKAIYGSYWKHVLGYWKYRNDSNLLIIRYEDMKRDLASVIKKVANFLNKELADEQIQILAKHLSFESMKKNRAVNAETSIERRKKRNLIQIDDAAFIRSGTVGKYKEEMSPETIKRFDSWIKENIDGTDFGKHYDYNL